MENVLVSIIVPIYNVAELLPRTIESILTQSYENFELILVNDGSSDNSGIICDEFAVKDNRIKVFHNTNAGAGAARKYGVDHAKGRWIMFVDGDDTISNDCLERLLSLDNGEYDIISGTVNNNNVNVYHHSKVGEVLRDEYISLLLQTKTHPGPVAKLIKRDCWKKKSVEIPKHITNNEDMLMLIIIANNCKKIYLDNDIVCYNYYWRETSASKSITMPLESWIDLFKLINNEICHSLNKDNIMCSFIKYRLRRLYLCCMLKGIHVGLENSYVADFFVECNNCKGLDLFDHKVINLISNPRKQRFEYNKYVFTRKIKDIIKRIIGGK